jgi:tetratricopeptide (TPR) repeat protein
MTTLRLLLPLLLLSACATRNVIERSRQYARLGDYMHAYQVLEDERASQAADGGSVDEDLAAAHGKAKKEYLRDLARRAIFQERMEAALQALDELAALDPNYPELQSLRDRANHKLAIRAVNRAEEQLLRKEFLQAMASYGEALRIEPGLESAASGVAKVKKEIDLMTTRAQQQFLEAVRKLPEFRYVEVHYHSSNAIQNAPEREDARNVRSKAMRKTAEREMELAVECEKKGTYGAALLHYREAQKLDPETPGVEAKIVRMEREIAASVLVDKAQVSVRASRFEEARQLLGEAFDKSELSRGQVSELMMQVRQLEGAQRYQAARDLEVLGRKADALAAYEALAKDWAEGFSDQAARIAGLRVDIDGATTEWAAAEAAEAAGELEKALEHYRASETYYAGWKDGKARIQRLQDAIAKKAAEAAGGAGSQPPQQPE